MSNEVKDVEMTTVQAECPFLEQESQESRDLRNRFGRKESVTESETAQEEGQQDQEQEQEPVPLEWTEESEEESSCVETTSSDSDTQEQEQEPVIREDEFGREFVTVNGSRYYRQEESWNMPIPVSLSIFLIMAINVANIFFAVSNLYYC